MDLVNEAKEKVEGLLGGGKADGLIDKVEQFIDDKTGNKFASQVDAITDKAREALGGKAD